MKPDLLGAKAAIDWAESQFEVLQRRIRAWMDDAPYVAFIHEGVQHPKSWQIREAKPLPLIAHAETGAIINSLRASLDILVNVLAERNGHVHEEDMRFPFSQSASTFNIGKHAGRKAIKRLSASDQATIESLQPYHGGDLNGRLVALHEIDIARKHVRLIKTSAHIPSFTLIPRSRASVMRPLDEGYSRAGNTSDPNYEAYIRIEVTLAEGKLFEGVSLIEALTKLADAAKSVIGLFDV